MKESIFAKAKKARENKKGFTLVELIVVLVILAILAAILVPALLGWIDKAKEKQIVLNARTAYLAAQTLASEEYAKKSPDYASIDATKVAALAQVPAANIKTVTVAGGKVSALVYEEGGKTATMTIDNSTGEASWAVN
ncbi:type II secretion system protein [Murimonas intestini]|uniref:type II secretion system protein n=1 Tax=Murimonas intestini TaxID=1337051 RepID=UPI0011DE1B7D|nr:type II secretion system protein [Murimonas intestini]